MPKPLGGGGRDAPDRGECAVVVGQRLAHPHEDDVRQPAVVPVAKFHRGRTDLLEDLCRRQVALQPALTGRAERARHPAARLRRDADGVSLRIAHQHRLERRAVDRAPQHFSRLPGIALDLPDGVKQPGEQRFRHLLAHRRRQIGHLARVGDQPAVVLVGQLLAAECGQPELRDGVRAAGARRDRRGGAAASRGAAGRRPGAGTSAWAFVSIPSESATCISMLRRPWTIPGFRWCSRTGRAHRRCARTPPGRRSSKRSRRRHAGPWRCRRSQ